MGGDGGGEGGGGAGGGDGGGGDGDGGGFGGPTVIVVAVHDAASIEVVARADGGGALSVLC